MEEIEEGVLWVIIPEDKLKIKKEKVLNIINKYICLSKERKLCEEWVGDLEYEADLLYDEIRKNLQDKYNMRWISFGIGNYPKTDPYLIGWKVLSYLSKAYKNNLAEADLPVLKKFLMTSPGQELKGWQEWEKYLEQKKTLLAKE